MHRRGSPIGMHLQGCWRVFHSELVCTASTANGSYFIIIVKRRSKVHEPDNDVLKAFHFLHQARRVNETRER